MQKEIKVIYENIKELRDNIALNTIRVGDEFITTDIDGETVFICIKVGKKKIHFLRKYLLKDQKPMKNEDFDLKEWLNTDYKNSLPSELNVLKVNLIKEKEMFGVNKYGVYEDCKQINYFKNTKHRIATTQADAKCSYWYWLDTPVSYTSNRFCGCLQFGHPSCDGAGYCGAYVRPRFIIAR